MSDGTAIEWSDATWNPIVGCDRVSPGCAHCYALVLHDRRHKAWKDGRWPSAPAQYHQPFEGGVQLLPDRLDQPLRWRKPRRIFVNSLSDLFHELVPDEFIAQVFARMVLAPQHTYLVLTKRPERMRAWVSDIGWGYTENIAKRELRKAAGDEMAPVLTGKMLRWPLPNVWLGVSAENQHWADVRIPLLLETPAAVRFVSCEPLLGPLDLRARMPLKAKLHGPAPILRGITYPLLDVIGLDWIIAGGESGPGHRPMDAAWPRSLRDQCVDAGVPFFFKQFGGVRPKSGGRLLDGREWSGMPG